MSMGEESKITARTCDPSRQGCECKCPEYCGHDFSGEPKNVGGGCWSLVCQKCGLSAMEHDLWVMP